MLLIKNNFDPRNKMSSLCLSFLAFSCRISPQMKVLLYNSNFLHSALMSVFSSLDDYVTQHWLTCKVCVPIETWISVFDNAERKKKLTILFLLKIFTVLPYWQIFKAIKWHFTGGSLFQYTQKKRLRLFNIS